MFPIFLFFFIANLVTEILAAPPAICRAKFHWGDCGLPPMPVVYYWSKGSRCETGIWKGCLPNPNMFIDEYECVKTCIYRVDQSILNKPGLENESKTKASTKSKATAKDTCEKGESHDGETTEGTQEERENHKEKSKATATDKFTKGEKHDSKTTKGANKEGENDKEKSKATANDKFTKGEKDNGRTTKGTHEEGENHKETKPNGPQHGDSPDNSTHDSNCSSSEEKTSSSMTSDESGIKEPDKGGSCPKMIKPNCGPPIEPGKEDDQVCRRLNTGWFYDSGRNRCSKLEYGGCDCQGFGTPAECQATCVKRTD